MWTSPPSWSGSHILTDSGGLRSGHGTRRPKVAYGATGVIKREQADALGQAWVFSDELPERDNRLVLRVEVGDEIAVVDVHDRETSSVLPIDRIPPLCQASPSVGRGGVPRACGALASFASARS